VLVEVKTGASFSYAQLIRYLVERPGTIGVVWRILPNQVIVVDPQRHERLLRLCLKVAVKRGLDLLEADKIESCNHPQFETFPISDPQKVVDEFFQAIVNSLPKVLSVLSSIIQRNTTAHIRQTT
ncbi:MAG: hypothetical protein QXL10_05205, partial [Candidatus Bathyarchaeia archaeon]